MTLSERTPASRPAEPPPAPGAPADAVPQPGRRPLGLRLRDGVAAVRTIGRTVRLRITLLYSGLFLLSSAALLAVAYVLVIRAIMPPTAGDAGPAKGAGQTLVPAGPGLPPDPVASGNVGGDSGTRTFGLITEQVSDAIQQKLLVNFVIALAIMSVISIVLGWVVAGRMLRPLRTITGTVRDISATSLHRRLALTGPQDELKELGDTFDDLLDRLESSFRTQRQFVANASHELRTPLTRQRTIGQVALSDPDMTVESLRAAHERVLAAGAEQERLIEALLTLTRGNTGIDVREPFDLARLTAEVIDARESEARSRSVEVHTSIGPAIAAGHRNLAERLVTNLVDNALKYNVPEGGSIGVTTWTDDGRAMLHIANTGAVVPPESVDELYEPFRRLGSGRTARAEGLGLGLSIVRAIADAHDARLVTEAQPGGGLSITVAFPRPSPTG